MPRYRVHRMKEPQRENFRWAAHTGGLAIVKPKDYEPCGEVEASTPYAAWKLLLTEGEPLCPGDLLDRLNQDGISSELLVAKYIGFEPARWFVPEPKPDGPVASIEAGSALDAAAMSH